MSISRKSRYDIHLMKEAGRVVALVHQEMKNVIKEGMTTKQLDDIAYSIIMDNKCEPTFLGYDGYPASICVSVNEQVVHGIPSDKFIIKSGDIVSVDVGATYKGFVGDGAWTYPCGEISDDCKRLLNATEKALMTSIQKMKSGACIEEVGAVIEDVAKENNLGIVRQYGGHGVGRKMHEDPFVYNYRTNAKLILRQGMTIAIEPMLNLGCDEVDVMSDTWTVVTRDRKPSAHFEHTVLVTDNGPEILTIV